MKKIHQVSTFTEIDELNRFLSDSGYNVINVTYVTLIDYYVNTSTVCNTWYEFVLTYEMYIND